MKIQGFKLVTTKSEIAWAGQDTTGMQNGIIDFKESILNFINGEFVGGKFTIDNMPIIIRDSTNTVRDTKFCGRLVSDNFVSLSTSPTVDFEILTITKQSENLYQVSGNLTIKGIKLAVSLNAEIILSGETISASGTIVFHHAAFDMKFFSAGFKVIRSN